MKLYKITYLAFPLLVFLGGIVTWRSALFNISNIEIATYDLKCIGEEDLKNASALLGRNFFLIDSAEIEKILKKKFICIKSVSLYKKLPHSVKLEVKGRLPFAQIISLQNKIATFSAEENIATPSAEEIKSRQIIDDEGVVFEKARDVVDIPKVYVPDFEIAKSDLLKILQKIKTFKLEIKEAFVADDNLIIAGMPKIIFRLDSKIDTQLASLQLILNEAKIDFSLLELIDLRFDKPVVKLAPKKNG